MTQPSKPANPFASVQRLGASQPNAQGATQASTPQQPAPPAARPSPLSRLGPPRTHWRLISVMPQIVRFELGGLGDPFYRLLGRPLQVELGEPKAVIQAIETGGADVSEIAQQLDAAWEGYALKGAILLYTWRKELGQVLNGHIPDTNENETEETYDDDKCPPPRILRSLDLILVLNVLSRTRANILLLNAPLGLEGQYLNRSLFTDDPRLIALAMATGCIEESTLK